LYLITPLIYGVVEALVVTHSRQRSSHATYLRPVLVSIASASDLWFFRTFDTAGEFGAANIK
jgi:hypothetical protein